MWFETKAYIGRDWEYTIFCLYNLCSLSAVGAYYTNYMYINAE